VAGVGCGGDDDTGGETPDSAAPDATKDTGAKDTSAPDTSPLPDSSPGDDAADTSVPDTSTPDTSTDGGTDAKDTSVPDTNVPDTNVPDTNVPDTNAPDSNGPDTSQPDVDVSDTNLPDVNLPDTNPAGPSFDNPVQIPVTAVLNVNTVVTSTPLNGFPLTPMDGTGAGANTDFGTKSKMAQLSATANGLPDDAFFPASGTTYPNTQLHWNNAVNQLNSRLVQVGDTSFAFDVPPATYHQIVLYATSAGGKTGINVVITYSDTTTSGTKFFTVADWFNGPSASEFTLIGSLDRITAGNTLDNRPNFEITGTNIGPDTSKVVQSVTITNVGDPPGDPNGSKGAYVFYGAVGY